MNILADKCLNIRTGHLVEMQIYHNVLIDSVKTLEGTFYKEKVVVVLKILYTTFQTSSITAYMSASSARLSQKVLARLSLALSSCCCCWVLLSPCLARCGLWRVRVCHMLPL